MRGLPRAQVSTGIELEYDVIGEPGAPTMILVNGFSIQLVKSLGSITLG